MNPAIFLGLASALSYGVCDFVARFANREAGVLRTMLWAQGFMAVVLTLPVVILHPFPAASLYDWGLLLLSNFAIVGGTGCLYRGLATGRVSLVAPIMACYGAIGALLAIATGEKVGPLALIGLAAAGLGAVLSASSDGKPGAGKSSGWQLATGAALLYGGGFWLQGKFVEPRFGPLLAIWLYYVTAAIVVGGVCLARRCPVKLNSGKDWGLVLATGLLAAGGYAALATGQRSGAVAVVTALSAVSTAVTVILAFVFLKDKPTWKGWLGVGLVIAGVAILDLTA